MQTYEKFLCVGAMVNTFGGNKIGFILTICQQTSFYVVQLEAWFDARQTALFPSVLRLFQCTGVPESKQSALAFLFSVRATNKETAQMERIFRHLVENIQTVTPFSDSSGALLHPSSRWSDIESSHQGRKRSTRFDTFASCALVSRLCAGSMC